ncbi:hypothetical protein M0813_29060 [Anaeramoeba flamelloides]|uniref:Uncharacterized protein n=1 Tax=Anaeramoeba flamelloides TaxID=1746091 RepID=A0ABQ8XRW7_9EUKA|nr:hypothetical protein M0813_29060 [Anaeramoeba flamelloides]
MSSTEKYLDSGQTNSQNAPALLRISARRLIADTSCAKILNELKNKESETTIHHDGAEQGRVSHQHRLSHGRLMVTLDLLGASMEMTYIFLETAVNGSCYLC